MFGYIKPCKPELKIKEHDAYRAVYCGLCRQMGVSFGCFARLTLSYDLAFLCALHYGLGGAAPEIRMRRCCVNPLQKVPMCLDSGEDGVLSFGADVALLLIYYKLLDNIQDGGILKKIGWSLLRPGIAAAHRRAATARPALETAVAAAMGEQAALERTGDSGPDRACEPTAKALRAIFEQLPGDEAQQRVLRRMGYLLGRYVYLCDALDDMEKDKKTGNYNPYIKDAVHTGEAAEAAKASLFMTVGEVEKAYNLLELSSFQPVLDNVIYLGLAAGVEEIVAKKEKRKL